MKTKSFTRQRAAKPTNEARENAELRRTIRDLAAISALPAIWVDCNLERSIQNLTDVLRATLRAYTVCIRLKLSDGSCFETSAAIGLNNKTLEPSEVVEILDAVTSSFNGGAFAASLKCGVPLKTLVHPIFIESRETGFLVACYPEDVAPPESARVFLQVAANQICLLLQRHKDQENIKRTADALRSNDAQMRSLLNLMPAAVYACDGEGKITYYNRRAAEMWGREPKLNDPQHRFCAVYKCWFGEQLLTPEQTPMVSAIHEGKSFRNLEPVFERPDGTKIPVLVNIDPIFDSEGKPAGAINVFQDASKLKEIQEQLKRQANQLATFLETAAIGLHRVGPDGTILWANEAELKMLGYTAEEYIGHPISEFHADCQKIQDILCRLQRGETLHDYEAELRCKDGSIKTVLIDSSVLWENGNFIHTQCFTRDITQQKVAEKKLRENERRFRQMIDSLPAAIYTTDAEGHLTHFNPAAVQLSGRVPEIGTDKWCINWKLYSSEGEPLPHDQCPMAIALKEGRSINSVEAIAERPDGTRIWFAPYPTPIRDTEGRIVGGINMLVDITDRKKSEEAILRQTELFQKLTNNTFSALCLLDSQGVLKFVNPAFEKITGYSSAESIGRNFHELLHHQHPDGTPFSAEKCGLLKACRDGLSLHDDEEQFIRKDGTCFRWFVPCAALKKMENTLEHLSNSATSLISSAPSTLCSSARKRSRH